MTNLLVPFNPSVPRGLITAGPSAPPPPQPQPRFGNEREHWAERIFSDGVHAATKLRHVRDSRCFSGSMKDSRLGNPPGSRVLFKLAFDSNLLSMSVCLRPEGADITRLLCRWVDDARMPAYSAYGVHEVCIRRKGSSLQFKRWSNSAAQSKVWVALFFKSWEKMVLFHSTFVALKARCPLTRGLKPEEYVLGGERKLFQAHIKDDGFDHALTCYEDKSCHGLRLHAVAWQGELKYCPIWTAFITYQSTSPRWLKRTTSHRVRLLDLKPYVFCDEYKWKHQRKSNGEFEIYFVREEAADRFVEIFDPPTEPDSSSAATSEIDVPGPA